ncbi:DUF3027 domain-containing protein [Arthrobacter sp. TWP1-1]|uniref:DUF3027 domain-containing protein n=1 Tax=Arthrobacter sp. TWP1-1 TaxID=2804568 RepID=UPI003CF636E7
MTELSGESTGSVLADSVSTDSALTDAADAVESESQRPGIPLWRVGKPDSFLAGEVSAARKAVLSIAATEDIGKHVGARSEGVRCVTHLFESEKPGYRGWVWFATLSRISRGKEATVNEVGMLPTEDSVLAPAWVPWSERVRPEDQQAADEAASYGAHGEPHPEELTQNESDDDASSDAAAADDEADDDEATADMEQPQGVESTESNQPTFTG